MSFNDTLTELAWLQYNNKQLKFIKYQFILLQKQIVIKTILHDVVKMYLKILLGVCFEWFAMFVVVEPLCHCFDATNGRVCRKQIEQSLTTWYKIAVSVVILENFVEQSIGIHWIQAVFSLQ